jgi:hypothetical protein
MSWWYEQLLGSILSGVFASLTWGLMVWMGNQVLVSSWGWLQGLAILTLGNGILWFFLVLLQSGFGVWLLLFFSLNGLLGYFLINLPLIQVPPAWAMGIHPLAISIMLTLLGGATAKF